MPCATMRNKEACMIDATLQVTQCNTLARPPHILGSSLRFACSGAHPTTTHKGTKPSCKKRTQWGCISSGWTHLCKQNGRKLENLSYIGGKRLGFVWKQHLLPTPNFPLPLHKQTQYPFQSLRRDILLPSLKLPGNSLIM